MRARDLVQPLPQEPPHRTLRDVLPWLLRGVPVAVTDPVGWRYVRPIDALAAPATRQLCDVPSHPLPTVDIGLDLDTGLLFESEVLGVTRGDLLVGGIDCSKVLVESARLSGADSSASLAVAVRDRLMPKFLHDLANVLTLASMADPRHAPTDRRTAHDEALGHASVLLRQMRMLYVSEPPHDATFSVCRTVERIEAILSVAAAPASLVVTRVGDGVVAGEAWRLERVLLNLILNASEAPKCARVELHVTQREGEVRIDVDDDGPGFSLRHRREQSLRGHGLAVVRRQMALLGGRAAIGASPLGGARVQLALPIAP